MDIKIYIREPSQFTKFAFQVALQGDVLTIAASHINTGIALSSKVIDLSTLQKGHMYDAYFLDTIRWSALFDQEDEGEPRYNYLALNYFSGATKPEWNTRAYVSIYRPNRDDDPVLVNVKGARADITSSENISVEEIAADAKFTPIVIERYPEFRTSLEHSILAMEQNVRLNQLRLMLHLMPQIDALSKIIFTIVERDPELKSAVIEALPQYTNYKSAIEEQNYLSSMSDDEALEAMRTLRTRDLAIFTDYLARKVALLEGGEP